MAASNVLALLDRQSWFEYRDCSIAVSEAGEAEGLATGRQLVFLHGRYATAECWRPVVSILSPHYPCLSVDLPGFGRSFVSAERPISVTEHAALLHRLLSLRLDELHGLVLIGHDIGGAIAQAYANVWPKGVAALGLVNPQSLSAELQEFPVGRWGWKLRRRLRRLEVSYHQDGRTDCAEQLAELRARWRRRDNRRGMVGAIEGLRRSWPARLQQRSWQTEFAAFDKPVLLLTGARDDFHRSRENADRLLQRLPDGYFFEDPECGYWPFLEKPAWVAGKLQEFLFRLSEERGVSPLMARTSARRALSR